MFPICAHLRDSADEMNDMNRVELACPYCAGRIAADAAPASRTATCPACGRAVTVQAMPPPPPVSRGQGSEVGGQGPAGETSEDGTPAAEKPVGPVAPRTLTPREQERHRRTRNLAYAVAGILALAVILAILLQLRP